MTNSHEKHYFCGSNAFQDYFDDAKESRVKQIPKIQESSFKNQVSRIKIQESREDSIKISIKKFFKTLSTTRIFHKIFYQRVLLSGNRLPECSNRLPVANIVFKTDLQSCNRLP